MVLTAWPSAIDALPGGVGEVDAEGLASLFGHVTIDLDGDGLGGLAGGEGDRPTSGEIVVWCDCRVVGGRVVDRHRRGLSSIQSDDEGERGLAAVALGEAEIGDVDLCRLGLVVVEDRRGGLCVADGCVAAGVGEVDEEGLVRLDSGVAVDLEVSVLVVSPGAKVSVPLVAV
jgi:hypothetical protein